MNQTTQESLGSFLRSERERRNISVEQLAYATRIGLRMLRALENDQFQELPAQAFVRGYLQAYGKYLGLDVQDLLLRYQHHLAASPNAGKVNIQSHYLYVKERYQERRQLFLIISLFAALLICAGTYALLKVKREHAKAAKVAALKPAQAPEGLNPSTAPKIPTPMITDTPSSPVSSPTKAPVAAAVVPAPTPPAPALAPKATTTAPAAPAVVEAPSTTVPTPIQSPAKQTKFILVLQASEEAWIRYQTDTGSTRETILKPGQSLSLNADKVFKLYSGRLASLTATLNGTSVSLVRAGRNMSAVLPEAEIPNYPLPLFPQAVVAPAAAPIPIAEPDAPKAQ